MKKIKLVVVAFIIALLSMPVVNAECDTAASNKLSSLANNVKESFETIEKEVEPDPDWNPPDGLTKEEIDNYVYKVKLFKIYINNITEDLYVVVTNNSTQETKTYNYSDTENGTISFEKNISSKIVNYTIEVYASSNTDCSNQKLRTIYLALPMYNVNSGYSQCKGIEEFYLCHEYLSVETSFEKFEELTEQYRAGKLKPDGTIKEEEKKEGFTEFLKEHKGTIIISSIAIIAIGGLVIVIIVKKQRSRIL